MKPVLANINNRLNKPFPFYETFKQKIIVPFFLSLLIIITLILFNPSDNSEKITTQIIKVFTYGFITFAITAGINILLPVLFPKYFDTEKWNVKKMILFTLSSILLIGIANSLFAYRYDNPNQSSDFFSFLLSVFYQTLLIGFFPTIILIFYGERILYKKNTRKAIEIIKELRTNQNFTNSTNNNIVFAPNTKNELSISENDLYYIKSEGNYAKLIYQNEKDFKKKLIRSSLKEIEQNLNPDIFFRCHKSYIINRNKISDVTGNAKGYLLHISELNTPIPTSRNISKNIIVNLKKKK